MGRVASESAVAACAAARAASLRWVDWGVGLRLGRVVEFLVTREVDFGGILKYSLVFLNYSAFLIRGGQQIVVSSSGKMSVGCLYFVDRMVRCGCAGKPRG